MCDTCNGRKSGWTLSTVRFTATDWWALGTLTAAAGAEGTMPVGGYLLTEGVPTGDKRMIAANALRWETPMPLRRVREDFGAHTGAVTVGAIEYVEREADGRLRWTGKLFNTEDGLAAYAEMRERFSASGLKYGISVDLDDPEVEVDDDEMMTVTSARLRGATLCDIPAFHDAYGVIEDQEVPETEVPEDELAPALVAAAVRQAPTAWFLNPRFEGPAALTVTPEGHVFGHMALWSTCHTGFPGMCVQAPKSRTGYSYFRTGLVRTTDGDEIPVGHLTMDTGHAGMNLSAKGAVSHYDHTGMIVCDLAAGEDAHGIWIAGALREGVGPEKAAEIQAAAVSGDWREIQGSLELVALLSVVSPGFVVPRARALAASGVMKALIATSHIEEAPVDEAVVETPVEETPAVEAEVTEPAPPTEEQAADLATGGDEHNELAPEATTEIIEDTTITLPPEEEEPEPVVEEEPGVPAEEDPVAEVVEEELPEGVVEAVPAVEGPDVTELLKRLDGLAGLGGPPIVDLELLDRLAGVS